MRKKLIIITLLILGLLFLYGTTYSIFYSNAVINSNDQEIAKFVFNSELLDSLSLPLIDLKPGDIKEYNFDVSNSNNNNTSDVTIEYQLTLKTYHLIPLTIELYKVNNDQNEIIMNCDESYTRNDQNELICNTNTQTMNYSVSTKDSYKLKITFDSSYNASEYSNLVDYINVEIKSAQKVAE